MNQKNLKRIIGGTEIWAPDFDIVLPINGLDIPDFREWINWGGWKGYSPYHNAYDFAAYLTEDGGVVLGLPKETPVRSVADGIVRQVSCGLAETGSPYAGYACFMNIEHGSEESGLFSSYHHIDPIAQNEQEVKKGDIVATLHKDIGNEVGRLVHLHFELTHGWNVRDRKCNPESIYPTLVRYRCEPQGSLDFRISGLPKQPKIYIANFKRLLVNNS